MLDFKAICIVILSLISFGCNSDDYYSGIATLELNDETWSFKSRAVLGDNGLSLFLDGEALNSESDICSISLYNLSENEGDYIVSDEPKSTGKPTGTLSFVEQDVTLELYTIEIDDNIEDVISIDDKRRRNIQGSINISVKNITNYLANTPDSIIIIGTFDARYER